MRRVVFQQTPKTRPVSAVHCHTTQPPSALCPLTAPTISNAATTKRLYLKECSTACTGGGRRVWRAQDGAFVASSHELVVEEFDILHRGRRLGLHEADSVASDCRSLLLKRFKVGVGSRSLLSKTSFSVGVLDRGERLHEAHESRKSSNPFSKFLESSHFEPVRSDLPAAHRSRPS